MVKRSSLLIGMALVCWQLRVDAQTFSLPPPVPYISANSGVMLNNLGVLNMSQQMAARTGSVSIGPSSPAQKERDTSLGRRSRDGQTEHLVASTSFRSDAVAPGRSVAAKLSEQYPLTKRSEAERVFRELLVGYRKIETQFGIRENDVAGAVAAFIAGSYMSYRDVDFPDESFKPLVAQMRQAIGNDPAFARASEAEKRELYEQMVILGMFMATTQMALKEKPNAQIASNMRQAAKGYLEQFLKADADKVEITSQGLVIR